MAFNQLPGEITDRIIDTLQDDNMALRACHLANRVFRSRARYNLFRSIRLTDRNTDNFIQCFENASELAGFVHKLQFEDSEYNNPGKRSDASFVKVLDKVGPYFKNVTALFMDHTFITLNLTNVIVQHLPKLDALHVINSDFSSPDDLFRLLASMHDLFDLRLYNLHFPPDSVLPTSLAYGNSIFCSSLKSLTLSCANIAAPLVLRELLASGKAKEMIALGFRDILPDHVGDVQLALDAAGDGLYYLYLGYNDVRLRSSEEPVFNLSKLTKLQYLEIQFYIVDGQENGGDADRRLNGWTLAVVQTLTSKTLKSFSSDDVYVQFRVPDDVQENEQEP